MNQLEKIQRLLRTLKEIHTTRMSRLEKHLGPGAQHNCKDCKSWKFQGEWKVDYCAEAERLAWRIHKVEGLTRAVSIAVLENIEKVR